MFERLLNRVVGSASHAIGNSIGDSIGDAIGDAFGKVTDQAVDNITDDMRRASDVKQMALDEQQKINNLPTHCPHCNAPTNRMLVCEYCGSKIVQ